MLHVVTVFGSANTQPESSLYALAEELGRLLARAKLKVCSGGYGGIMEAVSKGAHKAGGIVIGITCDNVFRARRANPYLSQEIRECDLLHRMLRLVTIGDAYVALPGSTGTLTEVFYVWNRMLLGELPRKPLALLGNEWFEVMDVLLAQQMVSPAERNVARLASNAQEAVRILLEESH